MDRRIQQKFMRGQVWFMKNNAVVNGSVQAGDRPILIVQNDVGNYYSDTLIVVPITSQPKSQLPTHVTYDYRGVDQTVLCEQVRTVSSKSLTNYHHTLSDNVMYRVSQALGVAMGLEIKFPSLEELDDVIERIVQLKVQAVLKQERLTGDMITHIATTISNKFGALAENPKAEEIVYHVDNAAIDPKELVGSMLQDKDPAKFTADDFIVPIEEKLTVGAVIGGITEKKNLLDDAAENNLYPKDQKRTRRTWTDDMKKDFIKDCEDDPTGDVSRKWNISDASIPQYYHKFCKELNHEKKLWRRGN